MTPFSCLDGQIQGVKWGKGLKVLAFHGYLDNAMSFKALSDYLPNVEVWAIDLPGHGHSATLPKNDGTFILNWLPMLGRLLDELAWDDYIILGHSMGAVVSHLLSAIEPRIKLLISMDALGPIASNLESNLNRYQLLYDVRSKTFPMRYYDSFSALVDSRKKGMFPLSDAASEVMAQRAVGNGKQGWFHKYDRQLRHESLWRLNETEAQGWLARINCPLRLANFGADKWPAYEDVFQARINSVPDIEVTQMQGSHHLHMEEPERVAEWVLEQLNELDSSPAG
jgi:pimeloyl-ACP methyl ester carboxylesterase